MRGPKGGTDRNNFYIQTNNSIEALLKKVLPKGTDGVVHGWLESCGPSAFTNCIRALGIKDEVKFPTGAQIQMEDAVCLWLNDPANKNKFQFAGFDWDSRPVNEFLGVYPPAARELFAVRAEMTTGDFAAVATHLCAGDAVQIMIPGHHLAVVAYDEVKNELLINDSWPGRTGGSGFNIPIGPGLWKLQAVRPEFVVYHHG